MEVICLKCWIFGGLATQVDLFYLPLSLLCMGRNLDCSVGKCNLEDWCIKNNYIINLSMIKSSEFSKYNIEYT